MEQAGWQVRYLRLTVKEVPFRQKVAVSGLRVFGLGHGALPQAASQVQATRISDLDMEVRWHPDDAVGHNILWGSAPDKLYHSYMVLGRNQQRIGALMQGQPVWVRVDSFNESGIAEGNVIPVETKQ